MEPTVRPHPEAEPVTATPPPASPAEVDGPAARDTTSDEASGARAPIDEGGEAPCWAHLDIIEN